MNNLSRYYHFTDLDHARRIRKEGITRGAVFIPGRGLYRGYIWLTTDPRFEAQHWATNHSGLAGDRTRVRLTLDLPIVATAWNLAASSFFGLSRSEIIDYNLAGGSDGESWFLVRAPIGPGWIVAVDKRPL